MLRYTKQDFVHQLETGIDRIENAKQVRQLVAAKQVTLEVKRRKVNGKDKFYFVFEGLRLNTETMPQIVMNWAMNKYFPKAKCYRVKETKRFWKEW